MGRVACAGRREPDSGQMLYACVLVESAGGAIGVRCAAANRRALQHLAQQSFQIGTSWHLHEKLAQFVSIARTARDTPSHASMQAVTSQRAARLRPPTARLKRASSCPDLPAYDQPGGCCQPWRKTAQRSGRRKSTFTSISSAGRVNRCRPCISTCPPSSTPQMATC